MKAMQGTTPAVFQHLTNFIVYLLQIVPQFQAWTRQSEIPAP